MGKRNMNQLKSNTNLQSSQLKSNTKKDLAWYEIGLGGIASGITQVTISQPFELVKTRIQNNLMVKAGVVQTTRNILKLEGFKTFYRGSSASYIGMSSIISIRLFSFQNTMSYTHNTLGYSKLASWSLSSLASAAFSSIFSSPIELIRIQMQKNGSDQLYRNPKDCLNRIIKNHGLRNGLFRGYGITLTRDILLVGKRCLYNLKKLISCLINF